MKFSVLMSVYIKENNFFFISSLESILNQTLCPDEIILVKDGPLENELEDIINNYASMYKFIKVLSLSKNMGLGYALKFGLEHCSHDLVARMDSDDICFSNRFEKQIKFMAAHPEVDVLGTDIAEFDFSIDKIVSYRKLPSQFNDIVLFAKRRNPLNHVTVIFRKTAVLKAGSYLPFNGYEDYYLWIRMLLTGSKFFNISENLVFVRIGNNMLAKRQGIHFFKQELKLQQEFLNLKFINKIEYFANIFLRAIPRLFPIWGLKIVYKFVRK
ncbi:MAG: glycosyltransferase [Bacteroidota bacterium]